MTRRPRNFRTGKSVHRRRGAKAAALRKRLTLDRFVRSMRAAQALSETLDAFPVPAVRP
jgi:hypothetical protein